MVKKYLTNYLRIILIKVNFTNNIYMDYTFDIMLIKPNHPFNEKSCYYFEEFFNKILGDNITEELKEPINNIDKNLLLNYIESKNDFLEIKNINFNNLLYTIYNTINPADAKDRALDVKTCFNDINTLIMYTYDQSIIDENQYNHIATLFNPTFEAIFGPIIMTKMIKNDKNIVIKHDNITITDFINLWISLKQVFYWNFENDNWNRVYMINNNKNMGDYNFIDIQNYMFFYKLKKNEDNQNIKDFIINNINNINAIKNKFTNLKICKLRLNEYATCTYNSEFLSLNDEIINSIKNVYTTNKDVIMECLFMHIEEHLPKLK